MLKTKLAKGLSSTLLLTVFAFSPFLSAEAASKPSIKDSAKKGKDYITLTIDYNKLSGKKVKVQIEATEVKTNKATTKTYTDTLSSTGRENIKVKSLKANTQYEFRVRVKRSSGSSYSSWSKSRKFTTKS